MYCVDGTHVKFELGQKDVVLYMLRRELPSPDLRT